MAVMVEELKGSPKRDFRSSKSNKNNNNNNNNNNNQQQKLSRTSILEALAKEGKITSYIGEDGKVKMKILVKKQDLKQILGAMNNAGIRDRPSVPSVSPSPVSAIERRLCELKRKKKANAQAKVSKSNNSSSWRPVLQSIPEEH